VLGNCFLVGYIISFLLFGWSISSWWRDIGRIRDGDGETGVGWFGHSVMRRVGDGAETLFWLHRWIGDTPLCVRFRRLFDLAENKTISVANLISSGLAQEGGVGVGGVDCGHGRRIC
jgi:hypothetical protein